MTEALLPMGGRMTRAGADDVASETKGMTVSKGWHGAKHFGPKKKYSVLCVGATCAHMPMSPTCMHMYALVTHFRAVLWSLLELG